MNKQIKKGLVLGIIVLFVGAGVIPSMDGTIAERQGFQDNRTPFMGFNPRGNILYVGGSGPNNYTSIQDAINDAVDGDTVFVYAYSSPYDENVVVNKSINLIGEDKNSTIIDTINGPVIALSSNNTIISGFTISHNNEIDGVILYNANLNNITKNIFIGSEIYHSGIISEGWCCNNIISENIFYASSPVIQGNQNLISKNFLSDPPGTRPSGIFLTGSPELEQWATYNKITLNTIIMNNKSAGGFGILMRGCKHNTISNNTIIGSGAFNLQETDGIFMQWCFNNSILNNNITNCMFGVNIQYVPWGGLHNSTIHRRNEDEQNFVLHNNFFRNLFPGGVEFISYLKTIWTGNFWNRPRILPKIIIGLLNTGTFKIPARLEFDWRPAREPYEIP